MSLLPVKTGAGRVYLRSGQNASDAFLNGLRVTFDEQVRVIAAAPVQFSSGWGMSAIGNLCYIDATAGLPAGTTYSNGLPFTPDGRLCISTDPVAVISGGIPFVANGSVAATITG